MRNTGFIAIILALAAILVIPRMGKTVAEWHEAKEEKKREYRSRQLHNAVKEVQENVMGMQRYSELRTKEKSAYLLSPDEQMELNRLTDNLGYYFERQGKKLTKSYGIQRFNRDEIDVLVGIK